MSGVLKFLNENAGAISALSGILVAAFTAALWRSTNRLWAAGEQQVKLLRDEFYANHRPWLSANQFSVNWESMQAEVVIVSSGLETPKVFASEVFFHFGPLGMPYAGRGNERLNAIGEKTLPHGHLWRFPVPPEIQPDLPDLWIVGRIVYFGHANAHHNLIFARKYDVATGRFRPDERDIDYNLST